MYSNQKSMCSGKARDLIQKTIELATAPEDDKHVPLAGDKEELKSNEILIGSNAEDGGTIA